ncbi:hypothetical protein TREMEDRAFT_27313, partial [Tremella mesenterica DSM 1558]|uniref:uncharacterized protein n=1 Tax=Tremella mesenterica (strain ATCC 24925 / CBS 8224 / DSM 1558 / NBRC 9311 / NRRL Y-6157 / RJB 2259-6 / UBC 559-6) TaxID=578456 RepID=UPI0003F4A1E3
DVNSEDQVKELIKLTIEHYGRLDAAVNNAACALDDKIFGESSTDKFREMIETNVLGVFWCMQQEIKAMLNNGGGSIVNLTSMAGLNGIPLTSTYSATKHAVVGLTKSAALDYATQNIRINAVAPGAIRTEILNYAIESGAYPLEAIEGMFPMKRLGEPEEVAQGIAFLLENTYTTGTVLSIDGGFNAK